MAPEGRHPAVKPWIAGCRGALLSALLAATVACVAVASAAEIDPVLERRVKAAFLYQFIPYVEWPASAAGDGPIVIAVAGSDETVAEVASVIGARRAGERPVVVRRWRESDLAGGAHIVYVRSSANGRLAAIARAAAQTGTLVVSEADNGLAQGGMVNFDIVEGKVRFDVSLPAVEKAGLRISSRLLAVAREVRVQP
jgi:hypothetical protein